ncbi:SPOR domain-containing protein [Gracilinema caldarium]|uniref:SPOR domain-containing protein n=1 Tax=Gracilinema caldarium TaxID=215591 RepID=UPI0026EE6C15|nr:SPOR domain-containing protein [Gracilinema caldarium]
MKKLMTIVFILISCVNLMAASIWEGAAAMASGGELPEKGYYIATNSFPRNTMVDVMNLENGKTLRAVVVSGIDTPGLLGILSREAAMVLGIDKGMVGRIRVNMPADPIAFSRYTEELNRRGDPDRDPVAALSLVEDSKPETKSENSDASTAAVTAAPDAAAVMPNRVAQEPTPATSEPLSQTALEIAEPQNDTIQELADTVPQSQNMETEKPESQVAAQPEIAVLDTTPSSTNGDALVEPVSEIVSKETPEIPETVSQTTPEDTEAQTLAEATITSAIDERSEASEAPNAGPVSPEATTPAIEDTIPEGPVELVLEPAEERPPVAAAPIEKPAVPEAVPDSVLKSQAPVLVGPIPEAAPKLVDSEPAPMVPEKPAVTAPVVPEKPDVTEPLVQDIPPVTVSPIQEKPAVTLPMVQEKPIVTVPTVQPEKKPELGIVTFSVPLVTSLEKGKYYVQLGSFTHADSVELQIKKISGKYPLLIQLAGTADKPVYRLMIGPLNHGESGAVVTYFKKSGYKDAFVKQEG